MPQINKDGLRKIPKVAIIRIALYVKNLDLLEQQRVPLVSSVTLADMCGVNPAQIRKDLAYFGQFGTRGVGYYVTELHRELRTVLGSDHVWRLGLLGVGNLGKALLHHGQFAKQGFSFTAAFDTAPQIVGQREGDVEVFHVDDIRRIYAKEHQFDIAVLATPAEHAQESADIVVNAGVNAILNFTPIMLQVPSSVYVENVDFSARMHLLCYSVTTGRDVTQQHRR